MAKCWLSLSCKDCFIGRAGWNVSGHCISLDEADAPGRSAEHGSHRVRGRLDAARWRRDTGRRYGHAEPEILSQVYLADPFVTEHRLRGALGDDGSVVDDVRPIADAKGVPHVVIGDQDSNPALAQVRDDLLNVQDRDRIDAREWLVEEHELRIRRQRARDLHPAALTPGQAVAALSGEVRDIELAQECFEAVFAIGPAQSRPRFEYRHDVISDREVAEDRRLLRKIAKTGPGPDVDRAIREIVPVEVHGAGITCDEADDHVEARRLARAVRPEQADDLSAAHGEAYIVDDQAVSVAFRESARGENCHR